MLVAGVIAALVGSWLARNLSRRVRDLVDGAKQITEGHLETQLPAQDPDELGELAGAFNAMATSLGSARNEILLQTKEIKAWNKTLGKKVDQKTEELRKTQGMLVRSRALAAIGGLGAGAAHEIKGNPLTGILGLSQFLLADLPGNHPSRPLVADIETQAVRIQRIVANLLRLSEAQDDRDQTALDLSKVVDDALELIGKDEIASQRIHLHLNVAHPSPAVLGNGPQLQAAILQLLRNAQVAMAAPLESTALSEKSPPPTDRENVASVRPPCDRKH